MVTFKVIIITISVFGKSFSDLGAVLVDTLQIQYNLKVEVSEPVKDTGNVDTWKIKVYTRMERRGLRINIDICALPGYEKKPMILKKNSGVIWSIWYRLNAGRYYAGLMAGEDRSISLCE